MRSVRPSLRWTMHIADDQFPSLLGPVENFFLVSFGDDQHPRAKRPPVRQVHYRGMGSSPYPLPPPDHSLDRTVPDLLGQQDVPVDLSLFSCLPRQDGVDRPNARQQDDQAEFPLGHVVPLLQQRFDPLPILLAPTVLCRQGFRRPGRSVAPKGLHHLVEADLGWGGVHLLPQVHQAHGDIVCRAITCSVSPEIAPVDQVDHSIPGRHGVQAKAAPGRREPTNHLQALHPSGGPLVDHHPTSMVRPPPCCADNLVDVRPQAPRQGPQGFPSGRVFRPPTCTDHLLDHLGTRNVGAHGPRQDLHSSGALVQVVPTICAPFCYMPSNPLHYVYQVGRNNW